MVDNTGWDPAADRRVLVTESYPDGRHLNTRRSIYQYREPLLDLVGTALAELPASTGLVVDVGCGDGAYTRRLRETRPGLSVLGLDLSAGMVAAAGAPGAVADATHLPLPDSCAAGVLAMHMLYHVPDPAAAVAELARVRRGDGVVVLASNAAGDKAELAALWRAAVADVTGLDRHLPDPTARCDLDAAERLAGAVFDRVRRIDLAGEVLVPDPAPVLAFMDSQRAIVGAGLPVDAVLARAGEWLHDTISRTGLFRLTVHTGVLVCD